MVSRVLWYIAVQRQEEANQRNPGSDGDIRRPGDPVQFAWTEQFDYSGSYHHTMTEPLTAAVAHLTNGPEAKLLRLVTQGDIEDWCW